MPDFSTPAVREYWHEYSDKMIYRVVTFMEGVEYWPVDDDPEVEAAIAKLGKQLDELATEDVGRMEDFIKLFTNLRCGRALRIMQALDSANPGSASKLLSHAETVTKQDREDTIHDHCKVFLRRNVVFERLRLLARVFSAERIQLVMKALEGEDG